MAKKNDKSTVSIAFENSLYSQIDEYAKSNEMDKSKVIRLAVKTFLASQPKKRLSKAS